MLPPDTPDEVVRRAARGPRVPVFDPRVGRGPVGATGGSRHRLVALGDSLTQGFQSGATINAELAYPALIARAQGWFDDYRAPRYGGPGGGLPLNVEWLLRDLEARFGTALEPWETPAAALRVRSLMDAVEDYWERGAGSVAPGVTAIVPALAVFSWDLRDALTWTAASLAAAIGVPGDDVIDQIVESFRYRGALRVYPGSSQTLLDAARTLGEDGGIETLVVMLGANEALDTVVELRVAWGDTVTVPSAFAAQLEALEAQVERIPARHVIWATVPHVTIAPLARGVGGKLAPGSRYFPHYTRPWISDARFDPARDPHITGEQARAVDIAIDAYNDAITDVVGRARDRGRDWYLFELSGVLDRLASRRFIEDPAARPPWWTPYPLPPALAALEPVPDSYFLTGDGRGGRATGGLFSLDGVHPTTVGYGLVAQELIAIMRLAGVSSGDVDFEWLIEQDTLVTAPPQNLRSGLRTIGWLDENLGWITRALT
jgi:hypothetical protein